MIKYGIARYTVLTLSVGRCILPVLSIPKESFTGLTQLLILRRVEPRYIFPSPVMPVDIIPNSKVVWWFRQYIGIHWESGDITIILLILLRHMLCILRLKIFSGF